MIIGCSRVEYLTFVSNTTVLILADAAAYIPLNLLCIAVHACQSDFQRSNLVFLWEGYPQVVRTYFACLHGGPKVIPS